ncbi:MAG: flagellar motor switch protein FliG [Burkholderiaceae bacterium]
MTADAETDGVDQAALLLLSMGSEAAAEVFRQLGPKETQMISEAMTRLRTVTDLRVEAALDRFESEMAETRFLVEDNSEYVREVLNKALGPDRASMILERILDGSDTSGIDSLKWMEPEPVAELIRNEHPQIIASILVHLPRDQASSVLGYFTDRLRSDVVYRIATLEGIQPTAMRELNDVLTKLLSSERRGSKLKLGGSKPAAEILNLMGAAAEQQILEWVREQDPDLAQQIGDQMFVFGDLINLDDKAIQLVLREVQGDGLILALKAADPELREKVFRNMSARAAETLRDDLESMGPIKLADAEAEQKEIIKVVKRLAEEGQIALGKGGDEDAYV